MQKRLVQSSLALTAAAVLSLGSAVYASPAAAAGPQTLDVQSDTAVEKALADIDVSTVNAYGESNGQLNLGVTTTTPEIEELANRYENVNIITGVGQLDPYAANDVVGGAGYLLSTAEGRGACSTGFSGWDDDGNPVVLTAGHCAKDIDENTGVIKGDTTLGETEKPSTAAASSGESALVGSGFGALGSWGVASYGTGAPLSGPSNGWPEPQASDIDFAVIKVDAAKYGVKNGVTDWTSAPTDDLSTSLATDIKQIGAEQPGSIEKSGRTTGLTEGEVFTWYNSAFQYSNVGGYWVHGFGVKSPPSAPFSQPGDSGGAVFQGDTALGVISGGGAAKDENNNDVSFSWVADLDYSLEQTGQSFNLSDPTAAPQPPAAPVVEKQTIKPSGEITGTATPNAEVEVTWQPAGAGAQAAGDRTANAQAASAQAAPPRGSTTVTADAEGRFSLEGPEEAGSYDYTATAIVDGRRSEPTPFTVIVEAADDGTGTEGSDAANADANAAGSDGGSAEGGDSADANAAGSDSGSAEGGDSADANAAGGDSANADAAGGDSADADAAGGDSANAEGGDSADAGSADASTGSDGAQDGASPVVERDIRIDPTEIAASEFVKRDAGVTITVTGFDEGERVALEVVAGPENVRGIELTETADSDGAAAFSVYGTSASDPTVYLGRYDVSVTGADDTADESALTGSFTVVADEDAAGGSGGSGSELPRTGAELTGLVAGAALLLVGATAVGLSMHRARRSAVR